MHSEFQIRHSVSGLLTLQDCHQCQDISGGQGLPPFLSPHPHWPVKGTKTGTGRKRRGPFCPTSWSPLGHQQRRQKARTWGQQGGCQGHSAQELGGGKENSLRLGLARSPSQLGTACALSFHFHCRLLSAIHNAKVNSYTAQFGRHKNIHQSAKGGKKKTSQSF